MCVGICWFCPSRCQFDSTNVQFASFPQFFFLFDLHKYRTRTTSKSMNLSAGSFFFIIIFDDYFWFVCFSVVKLCAHVCAYVRVCKLSQWQQWQLIAFHLINIFFLVNGFRKKNRKWKYLIAKDDLINTCVHAYVFVQCVRNRIVVIAVHRRRKPAVNVIIEKYTHVQSRSPNPPKQIADVWYFCCVYS